MVTERSDIPSKSLCCSYFPIRRFLCSGDSVQYNAGIIGHDSGDHESSTYFVCLLVLSLVSMRELLFYSGHFMTIVVVAFIELEARPIRGNSIKIYMF